MPAIRARLLNDDILVRPLGPVLYLAPPLITSEADLLMLIDAIHHAHRRGNTRLNQLPAPVFDPDIFRPGVRTMANRPGYFETGRNWAASSIT